MLRRWALAATSCLSTLAAFACGARTNLPFELSSTDAAVDSKSPDGSTPLPDGAPPPDSAPPFDVRPPIDVLPPVDVVVPPDAPFCPTGLTAYLFSGSNQLYTFDPTTLATHLLGTPGCPTSQTPWTLTASSTGTVYLLYEDWNIYEVDPATLACSKTPYEPGQLTIGPDDTFTVAPNDGGESLYVLGLPSSGKALLAVTDLVGFVLSDVGTLMPQPEEFPLDIRSDPSGRIFGLGSMGTFVEIDRTTASIVSQVTTSFGGGGSWALLTYNDGIYFFEGGAVSQYDRATGTLTPLGDVGFDVEGASAAPCIHR
jgi:hypothetical protein